MTTAGDIINQALDELLIFDAGRTDVGNDDEELFLVLNRRLKLLYLDAARHPTDHEAARDDYFAVSEALAALDSSLETTLTAYAWQPTLVAADGDEVHITTHGALRRGRAELPPAVYLRHLTVTSCGRAGDPVEGDVLTAHYTPIPGPLTDRAHFIGATTPADNDTSRWPDHVGDDWLVLALATYLATKSGDATTEELQAILAREQAARATLLSYVRELR